MRSTPVDSTVVPPSPVRARRRWRAALVTTAVLLTSCLAFVHPPSAAAVLPLPVCPVDPGDGGSVPGFTDSNVAVFAGGDYRAEPGTSESEGLLVSAGSASFATGGPYSLGAVGFGSEIVPPPGSAMLVTGGDVDVTAPTTVLVATALTDDQGQYVGGGVAAGGQVQGRAAITASFVDTPDPTFTTTYAGFGDDLTAESARLAGLATTGTSTTSGSTLTLTGAGTATLQVFRVAAADLAGVTTVALRDVPAEAAVVIDVTGDALTFAPNTFTLDGARVDVPGQAGFGDAASRLLWNVNGATDLQLGGASQFMGSVLAPQADARVTTSTNGRLLVGGDLTIGGNGAAGLEHHNYPWVGSELLDCRRAYGGFRLTKLVGGPRSTLVPPGITFTLRYDYYAIPRTVGEVEVRGDGVTVEGPQRLPAGALVVLQEIDLPSVPGVEWGTPRITVDGRPTDRFRVREGEVVEVSLTNLARATSTPSPTPPTPPASPDPSTPTPPTNPPPTTAPPTPSPSSVEATGSVGGESAAGGDGSLAATGGPVAAPTLIVLGSALVALAAGLLLSGRSGGRHRL